MSMAKFFLKAAKAILVGVAATAVGYAGYKTVKESVDAAKNCEHIIPRKNVYNFESIIVDRRTNNGRHVGCEANDRVKAHLKFCKMCNEFEYCEYESVQVTDFPDDYVKEGTTEFGEEKHYGTAEEYEHDAEYAMTPPTKKERRTVFFKQLGISFNDWFLRNETLSDTLMFSAIGLVSLKLGVLCGRDIYRDEQTADVKESAKSYGVEENAPWAVRLASWVNDGCFERGYLSPGHAVVFGATDNGTRFVSNASVFTEENGTKSVKFDNID